jgi:hypothetical protein
MSELKIIIQLKYLIMLDSFVKFNQSIIHEIYSKASIKNKYNHINTLLYFKTPIKLIYQN